MLDYLNFKGYPSIKVIKSKNGNYFEVVNNNLIALFEFIDIEKYKVKSPNLIHSKNLGKSLGNFHEIT